jgi:hypothetical protein
VAATEASRGAAPEPGGMTPKNQSPGGEAMLAVIATAVVMVVAAEAAFIADASWSLLPCILLFVRGAVVAGH